MSFGIWASASNIPITVCADARLRATKGDSTRSGRDTPHGQAGWNVGLNFGSLRNLADQLEGAMPSHVCDNYWQDCAKLAPGSINRLAINAHGTPGGVDVDCGRSGGSSATEQFNAGLLTAASAKPPGKFNADLLRIKKLLAADAGVLFMGCQAGAGSEGTKLVTAVSEIFPTCYVTAFATIGFSSSEQQARGGGDRCSEPGMRDTDHDMPALYNNYRRNDPNHSEEYDRYFRDRQWWDLKLLPWASEFSAHAKAARNGKLVWGDKL